MNILAWNSRGCGQPLTINALHEHILAYQPDIIFLSETKKKSGFLDRWKMRLNFRDSWYVALQTRSGGLVLWWRGNVSI